MRFTTPAVLMSALALSGQLEHHGSAAGQQVVLRGHQWDAKEVNSVEVSKKRGLQDHGARTIERYAKRERNLSSLDESAEEELGREREDKEVQFTRENEEHEDASEDEEIEDESIDEEPDKDAARGLRGLATRPAMSHLESINARYIKSFRKKEGCVTKLYYSSDLVKEAQRWSRRMARQGHVANRNPLDLNIDMPWIKIAEIPGKYGNVTYAGAMSYVTKSSREVLLDSSFNTVGVGIKKASSGAYYMTILLKQV
jgi:hypothetical protein